MKTELELQKEFIEKPELKEQLEFLKKGGYRYTRCCTCRGIFKRN